MSPSLAPSLTWLTEEELTAAEEKTTGGSSGEGRPPFLLTTERCSGYGLV
jgi:hypothetical protein